jgi:hypothetical protein
MATIAQALSRVPGIQVEIEDLKPIAVFSGVGLTVSLLLGCYGLDLSPGFL